MSERLEWLSEQARSRGWQLLARHRPAGITYVLKDESSEMDFRTLEEAELMLRNLCRDRGLKPMAKIPMITKEMRP